MVQLFADGKLEELRKEHNFRPTGVIHVGAGSANEQGLYNWLGIKNYLWLEAQHERIPALLEILPPFPSHHVLHNTAVWGEEGKFPFYVVSPRWDLSSFLEPNFKYMKLGEEQTVTPVEIQTFPLDDDIWYAVSDTKFDLLALDCQGSEKQVLAGADMVLKEVRFVMSVLWKRQVYKGCLTFKPFDTLLKEKGFTKLHSVWADNGFWGWGLYGKEAA
jgi:FkbM family methyltransferase